MKTAAVLLIMVNGNYTVDIAPVYFDTIEICEWAKPLVAEQVQATRRVVVSLRCYATAYPAEMEPTS